VRVHVLGSQLMCCVFRLLVLPISYDMCRFTALQSFNGSAISHDEVAAAGRLLGTLEGALDAALVRTPHPHPAHPAQAPLPLVAKCTDPPPLRAPRHMYSHVLTHACSSCANTHPHSTWPARPTPKVRTSLAVALVWHWHPLSLASDLEHVCLSGSWLQVQFKTV
jgi:hypothetical protein